MPKRVALLVDNPHRDLPSLVLLALRLCQDEAICFLVPMNLRNRELWALAPDFVLLNYLRSINQELARQLLDAGIKVGVLDTEGGVLANPDAYAKTMAPSAEVRHRIACYCSWGPKLAEHAAKNGWYLDNQLVVTGSPRTDFYVHPWRDAALQASPYAGAYPSPMVLINGNFPVVNPQFQTPEQELQMMVERFNYDRDLILHWQRVQSDTMMGLVELTNGLARRFPRATFVYRPHPFERLESYTGLLDKRDNLHLRRKGTVDGWILRSSAVIQRSCSTAIEAGIAGVPALSPAWIPTPVTMDAAEAVSIQCQSPQHLEQELNQALNSQYDQPARVSSALQLVIKEWFCAADGQAHDRVASTVLAHLHGLTNHVSMERCREMLRDQNRTGSFLRSLVAVPVRRGRALLSARSARVWRNMSPDAQWDRSEKSFDAGLVRTLADAILSCDQSYWKDGVRQIRVQPAQRRGDYQFGYKRGRSVVLFPE